MTSIVNLSRQGCDNKLILIIGGGYTPRIVPVGWLAMISAILEIKEIDISDRSEPPEYSEEVSRQAKDMIQKVNMIQKTYWKNL